MKQPLYPPSRRDRILFWLAAASAVFAIAFLALGEYGAAFANAAATLFNFSLSYFVRDKSLAASGAEEYAAVISRIVTMNSQLTELSKFLVREQQKIQDTEATVRKLNEEHSALAPVVQTQRETVEAILSAHAKRTAKQAWKERLIGFGSGVVASILASIVYEYLKR